MTRMMESRERDYDMSLICEDFLLDPGNTDVLVRFLDNNGRFEAYKQRGFLDMIDDDILLRITTEIIPNMYCHANCENHISEIGSYANFVKYRAEISCPRFRYDYVLAKVIMCAKREMCIRMFESVEFAWHFVTVDPSFIFSRSLRAFIAQGFDINRAPIQGGFSFIYGSFANRFMKYERFIGPLLRLGARIDFDEFQHFLFPPLVKYEDAFCAQEKRAFECCCKYAHHPNIIIELPPDLSSDQCALQPHKETSTIDDECDHECSRVWSAKSKMRSFAGEFGMSVRFLEFEQVKRILFVHRCLTQMRMRFFARATFSMQIDDPIREFVQTCPHLLKYIGRLLLADKFSNIAPDSYGLLECESSEYLEIP